MARNESVLRGSVRLSYAVGIARRWRAALLLPLVVLGWGCSPSPELERVALALGAKLACSAYYQQQPIGARSFADIVAADALPIDNAVPFGAPLAEARFSLNTATATVTVERGGERVQARRSANGGCVLTVPSPPDVAAGQPRSCAIGATAATSVPPDPRPWPVGDGPIARTEASAAVAQVLAHYATEHPAARALVVVQDGRLVAEHYAPGFDAATRHLGWSMAKTVGAMVLAGRLYPHDIEQPVATWLPAWRAPDPRAGVKVRDLLEMRSGLAWDESYASSDSDVLRMLTMEADMAAFAAEKPLEHPPGSDFRYSSGTSNILQAVLRNHAEQAGDDYCTLAERTLFRRIGAHSARFEQDMAGTNVASSYLYATARDWARFGLLLLADGRWPVTGEQVLPAGWTTAASPTRASPPEAVVPYGWQIWGRLRGWRARLLGVGDAIPADLMQMRGHWGQSITLVPSRRLVIVHLAWDTSLLGSGRDEAQLLEEVLASVPARLSAVPLRSNSRSAVTPIAQ